MSPVEGPSEAEIQKLKREKQQAEEAAKKAKLATTAATFIPGAQEFAPLAGAAARSAESRVESVAAQLKRAEEERRAAEERAQQQPQYAPASPALGKTGRVLGGIWRGAKKMLSAIVPETVAEHSLRAFLILAAAVAFYVVFKRLGIRAPFNIAFVLVLGVAAAIYELAPGPISSFFHWVFLILGGIGGFWILAVVSPASSYITKWITMVWLFGYTMVLFASPIARVKKVLILFFNIIGFGLLFTAFYGGVFAPDTPLYVALEGQQSAWGELYKDVKEFGQETATGIKRAYFIQFDEYEQGIEENREKPLGVYLKDVGVTSETISMSDKANVFATLKSQSFKTDKELKIVVDCYESDKQELPDKHGVITPKKEFNVVEDEEQPVDCNIDAANLGAGKHDITLEATFGFPTSAYVKGYFMLQDQIRAYKRQHPEDGASPLDEFGIADRSPIAVFTGGPLYVGMGVGLQPIPLPEENYGPTLTITLDRNWPEGELMKVKSLMVAVPPGLKVSKVSGHPVEKYCQVKENGEDTCILDKPEILDRLFLPDEKPVRLKKNIRVETIITDKAALMANAPLAIRSFKVTVDYEYRIKKQVSVTVQAPKPPPKKGGIA